MRETCRWEAMARLANSHIRKYRMMSGMPDMSEGASPLNCKTASSGLSSLEATLASTGARPCCSACDTAAAASGFFWKEASVESIHACFTGKRTPMALKKRIDKARRSLSLSVLTCFAPWPLPARGLPPLPITKTEKGEGKEAETLRLDVAKCNDQAGHQADSILADSKKQRTMKGTTCKAFSAC